MILALALARIVALSATARAQVTRADLLGTSSTNENAVELRAGAEDAFVAELAYARAVDVAGVRVIADGQFDIPWAELDPHDWRIRMGIGIPVSLGERWYVLPRVAPTVRVTTNNLARMVGLGVDLGATAGYFAPRWFAAVDLGVDTDLTTHIAPTSTYKMTVNDGAKTGWFSTPGGELRYGAAFGTTFGANDVSLRAGKLLSTSGDTPTLPFYGILSFARRW